MAMADFSTKNFDFCKNINNVPHDIAQRLNNHSGEYKNYLISTDYNSGLVKFEKVEMMPRDNARRKNTKSNKLSKVKFITTFNPTLPSIESLIKKHILDSGEVLEIFFPNNKFSLNYKRCRNLKEIITLHYTLNQVLKVSASLVGVMRVTFVKTFGFWG